MDKCYKMVGAFFSRVTSSHSRRRDANPQVVDVIRAVPHNGVPTKEAEATGAYKAGVWVWDAPRARTSPRLHRHNQGENDTAVKDQRKYHSMERSVGHTGPQPQLACSRDAHSITPSDLSPGSVSPSSTTPLLDNDLKHASLARRPEQPAHHPPSDKTENKYMTLPHVTCSSTSRPGARHALNTVTRNPCAEDSSLPRPPQSRRRWKDEEVRRLAKTMVGSIETLIENLHGIVGDLRELVQQIDAVTDSMDIGGRSGSAHPGSESRAERSYGAASKTVCTQTDLDQQQGHPSLDHRDYLRKCDRVQMNPSHRYSYPQYCHSPVSNVPSPSGFDTDRGIYRLSASPRRPGDGSRAVQRIVKSSSPQRQRSHIQSETRQDRFPKRRQIECSRPQQRPRALSAGRFVDSLVPALTPTMCRHSPEPSMPFIPVESPPNPAPTLFSAYREDGANQVKDSDSLPDRGLKTWKEKMERHGGSADSLTPQMDWSYLVLTDQHLCATIEECVQSETSEREKQFEVKQMLDPSSSLPKNWSGLRFSSHNPDGRRAQKDRSRPSLSGVKIKQQVGAITRIPEHGEPRDDSYDENCDVFTFMQTSSSVSSPSSGVSPAAHPRVIVTHVGQSEDQHSQNPCIVSEDLRNTGVFPQVQQSIGGASLGWNTQSKALPNWPSGELSSIGASDSDLDELSSPFLQQHFQYPRRSSALLDSTSDKTQPEAETKLNRTSSVPETIASGGFEVRTLETSPESDVQGSYGGQYENAMETRLEQMTNECSDFSDADADVGSDVLEQSLTSLEDPSSVKYDRELNTWTSYTMTHIDSDDVVSDSTSDILNENLFEIPPSNPGFDDVSLNFEDIGFLPLPLQGSTIDKLSPGLE